jgi:hypothetical protein
VTLDATVHLLKAVSDCHFDNLNRAFQTGVNASHPPILERIASGRATHCLMRDLIEFALQSGQNPRLHHYGSASLGASIL